MAAQDSTAREKLFSLYCAALGDAQEAALRAGYSRQAAATALELLEKPAIRRQVAGHLAREPLHSLRDLAAAGLARLALGPIQDAVTLLSREETPTGEELAHMDLFCVSELRRAKDGGLEVKFYDRFKALELLLGMEGDEKKSEGMTALLEALERGARADFTEEDVPSGEG